MTTVEIVVMSVFGLLVVGGIALSIRQGKQERARVMKFAAERGWPYSPTGDDHLASLLSVTVPEEAWQTSHVLQVQPPPERVYLFAYSYRRKQSNSRSSWRGFACLVERSGSGQECPVAIFNRTPLVDAMEGGRVQVGGEEFRKQFTVTCQQPEAAQAVVNAEVQHLVQEHDASPGWRITVTVAAPAILVASSWAQKEDEWEHLIALATRLRQAIP